MLRRYHCVRPPAPDSPSRSVRAVAGLVTTIVLAGATLAACADRGPTTPTRVPALAGPLSAATQRMGGPTREDIPDFFNEFVLDAGAACSFSVAGEPVVNRVVLKTFPADRNGDVVEMTTGALVERFTNLATGKSITVKISGPGKITRHPDGSSTQEAVGPWAWFFPDPSSVPGGFALFLSTGRMVVETTPTGEQTIVSQVGRLEDLCAALS